MVIRKVIKNKSNGQLLVTLPKEFEDEEYIHCLPVDKRIVNFHVKFDDTNKHHITIDSEHNLYIDGAKMLNGASKEDNHDYDVKLSIDEVITKSLMSSPTVIKDYLNGNTNSANLL